MLSRWHQFCNGETIGIERPAGVGDPRGDQIRTAIAARESDGKKAMGDTGFEQPASSTAKPSRSETGAAESGAVGAGSDVIDTNLNAIINARPTLPVAIKQRILAMVDEAWPEET